jgi:GT2 family glycosyltransferase
VLLFVDADIVAGEEALRRATTWLDELPGYSAAFGSYDDAPAAKTVVARFRNLLHHYTHQTGEREAETFWTGFGVVRRGPFEAVGGFDPAWSGVEDIEFGYRLRAHGYKIRLDPSVQVKHLKRWTLRSMVRTDLRYRARLWTRLILARGALPDDLNVRREQRLSVLLALIATMSALGSLFDRRSLVVTVVALVALCWINRGFYALLRRSGGVAFAAACIPLHVVYFLSAGCGFALAWLEHHLGLRATRKGARASV